MQQCRLVVLAVTLTTFSTFVHAEDPHKPSDIPVMVNAKLVGIVPRMTRNYLIGVKFATEGIKPQEIIFDFPAGRSTTPHRSTLKAILEVCIPDDAYSKKEWAVPAMEATFSIPQEGIGKKEEWIEHISVLTLKRKAK